MRGAEFEVKVKLSGLNLGELIERLVRLGFAVEGEVYEEDRYFDLRGCPWYRPGSVLRFRKVKTSSGTEYRLTYKGVVTSEGVKAREEVEVPLSDEGVLEVLEMLGVKSITIRKRRVYLRGGDLRLSVDEVECLGAYLEFEEVNPPSAEEFLAKVGRVLRALELEGSELIAESYLELYTKQGCG